MNTLFNLAAYMQQPSPGMWDRIFAWIQANWFLFFLMIVGALAVFSIIRWIIDHTKQIGIGATIVLIIVTPLILVFILWIVSLLIPTIVGFGPKTWNQTMAAAGRQPALIVPGDPLPPSPGIPYNPPGDSGGGQFAPGRYLVASPTNDNCSTLRQEPSADSTKLGCVPNGTEVRVLATTPSNCWESVCLRVQIEPVAGLAGGWLHAGTLGQYLGP